MWSPAASLNHMTPSRTTMESGLLPGVMPSLNEVMVPVRSIRPIWLTSVCENQMLPSAPSPRRDLRSASAAEIP